MISNNRPMREQHGPMHEDQPKYRFGNYDLMSRIDVGGMGEVYLAEQRTAFARKVAIKIIRSDLIHDVTARSRFRREAEVSAHLKHEHILPLYEFGEEQGRLFLVTPYIAGGTLARRLQKGPLSFAEVRQLFPPLVQAVAYIHGRGVIHRDLKPSNVLLDRDESSGQVYVRLIDFGIATLLGVEASPPLTEAETEVGTLAFMAPERLSGVSAPSNDIYSLGIILYEMLTGHSSKPGRPPALPPALDEVIRRCTATRPEDRFASCDEVLKAFEQACQHLTEIHQQRSHPSTLPPIPPRPAPEQEQPPAMMRENGLYSGGHSNPRLEARSLHRTEGMPPMPPLPPRSHQPEPFRPEDYGAPTTAIDGSAVSERKLSSVSSPMATVGRIVGPRPRLPRKNPFFILMSLLIVFVLIIIAGLLIFEIQPVNAVTTINVTPQVKTITSVLLSFTASSQQKTIDESTATIPATVLSSSKTSSQSGSTTGQVNCGLFGFGCKQGVGQTDVNQLEAQLKQSLDPQITQDLQKQTPPGVQVISGRVFFTKTNEIITPPVGTEGNTVTVSFTEQGVIEYMRKADALSLASKLAPQFLTQQMQKQLGGTYALLNSSIKTGNPIIAAVDNNGVATLNVMVGGLAQYLFSTSQLDSIRTQIAGLKLNDAIAYIQGQMGVDPASVSIHPASGDTLPTNLSQIKITLGTPDPATLPPVQLPGITPSPSGTATPTT